MFWPDEVSFGDVTYPPGGRLGPRQQHNLQLVIIHTGQMSVWIDGKRHDASSDSISLLFPGHEERFAFADDTETWHSYAHISFHNFPPALLRRLSPLPWSLPLSTAVTDLNRLALSYRHAMPVNHAEVLKSMAMHLLWCYVAEGETHLSHQNHPRSHPGVHHAKIYIQTHLAEPIQLNQIAEAASISPAHLIRIFQAELSLTPMAYLWQQRVQSGIELLERTGLPVGVIAERCGFQTSYHFSRRVRQQTGLSPREIRSRSWERR